MFALVVNDQLRKLNHMLVKVLKNRYADINVCRKFVIGVDRSKMRLFTVDEAAQKLGQQPTASPPRYKAAVRPQLSTPFMDLNPRAGPS
jgi:hypothetical protein